MISLYYHKNIVFVIDIGYTLQKRETFSLIRTEAKHIKSHISEINHTIPENILLTIIKCNA